MDEKVDEYINKQKSPQKEICQRLRELIFRVFPEATEEMKWGVPAFCNGKFYIVALKDHVNLGFSIKELTKEEIGLAAQITAGYSDGRESSELEVTLRPVGKEATEILTVSPMLPEAVQPFLV